MINTAERSKLSHVSNLEKEVLLSAKAEKVEMTLNTGSSVASGLLIQRLTELYENPVEATVRETTSNAIDAVVRAHSGDRPTVRISSPTSLNPVFVVKDNGIGMTYDDLKDIYSKYGASTKADDLEQVGAYGLGAKAPLAYGTEFTVTSVKDGHKTTIIVAREELTNYIKIIGSSETDDPSGTTVSVPVSTSDIDKFKDNINKYKETPLDKDVDVYIDGELAKSENYILVTDKVLTYDEKEKIYGRLWLNKDDLVKTITNLTVGQVRNSIEYVIGGWSYNSPTSRNSYHYRFKQSKPLGVIELKAGIVGFNSSRDAILDNERYSKLEELVVKYFSSAEFFEELVKSINNLDLGAFKEIVSNVLHYHRRYIKIEGKKIIVENSDKMGTSDHYRIPRNFKLEDFIHKETGFSFKDILKNTPDSNKKTVILQESKDFQYKTPRNSLMKRKAEYYSYFDTENVAKINEAVEEIMLGDAESHNLKLLLVYLSTFAFNKSKTKNAKVTFITNMETEKEIKKVKSARKTIVKLRNESEDKSEYDSIIVYTKHDKEEIEKMIEDLGFDFLDVKVKTVDEISVDIKKYRDSHEKEKKENKNPEGLSTNFDMYVQGESRTKSVNYKNVDKTKNNIIIVNKSSYYPSSERLQMILNWYCNTNDLKPEDVVLYTSGGRHKASDVEILLELGNVYRDPLSESAGASNVYHEKVHKNLAKTNAVLEQDMKKPGKAFMRSLTGVYGSCAERVANAIDRAYILAEEVSETSGLTLNKLSEDILETIKDYDNHTFHSIPYYGGWRLDDSSLKHLMSFIDKEDFETLEDLLMVIDSRRIDVSEDSVNLSHISIEPPNHSSIKKAFDEESNMSSSSRKLIKTRTESYIEFLNNLTERLELLEL